MRKIYGPKKVVTDELRGPGKTTRIRRRERCKDTKVAMVRPHKNDGRRKEVNKVTVFRKATGRPKRQMGRTCIGGRKKARNPQLEGEDLESEVMEESHKEAKTNMALEQERRKM